MSAELSGRFDIRGAVNGYVIREPDRPIHDALMRIKADCKALADRLRAKPGAPALSDQDNAPLAIAAPNPMTLAEPIAAALPTPVPIALPTPTPIVAGLDAPIQQTIPSEVAPSAKIPRRAALKASSWKAASLAYALTRASLASVSAFQTRLRSRSSSTAGRFMHGFRRVVPPVLAYAGALSAPALRIVFALFSLLVRIMPAVPKPPRKAATVMAGIGLFLAALTAFFPALQPETTVASIRPVVPLGPVWREIVRPLAVFNLEGGGLSGNALTYRVHARSDGAREDVMSWTPVGKPEAPPVGVMVVHRHPSTDLTEQRLFSEIARRAASFGLSLESAGTPNAVATKFGDLEVMDVRLSGASGEQSCLAFRHVAWSAPLAFSGWRCGTADKPIERPSLVCFIDRLNVMSAGQELWLRDYFAESERFRSFCAAKRVTAGKIPAAETANAAPVINTETTGSTKPKRKPKSASGKPKQRSRPKKP
jgi:hypothetical protein